MFFDPRGGAHYDGRWQPPGLAAREVEARMAREAETLGGPDPGPDVGPDDAPGGWTVSARWKREGDIPDTILFRAMEALGE